MTLGTTRILQFHHRRGHLSSFHLFAVPRKAETFQADIYPDTPGPYPALSADEWIAGIDRDPILVSMQDRIEDTNMPKITTYRTIEYPFSLSQRGSSQRAFQPPVAEVAPLLKSSLTDPSLSLPLSSDKVSMDVHQPDITPKGFKKVESFRMPANNTDFNHVR